MAPLDDATGVGVTPKLVGGVRGASPGGDPYEFSYTVCPVSATSVGSTCTMPDDKEQPPVAASGWVAGAWTVPAGKLKANTSYKWVVRSRNNPYVGSLFDQTWWFSTGSTKPTPTSNDYDALLKAPATQSVLTTNTPTLEASVRHTTANTEYLYEYSISICSKIDDCGDTEEVLTYGWTKNSKWTVPVNILPYNRAYVWTVSVADNPYIGTLFNPRRAFVIKAPATDQRAESGARAPRVSGVGLHSLDFEQVTTDASLPTTAAPLEISRSYSSLRDTAGAFGTGWASIVDARLTGTGSARTVALGDGRSVTFRRYAETKWGPEAFGEGMKLADCATPCTGRVTDLTGAVLEFEATGLKSVTSTNGQITRFDRDTAGKVSAIVDVRSGRKLTLTWSGARVSKVSLGGAPNAAIGTWTYSYVGDQLTRVCRPSEVTSCTTYAYVAGTPNLSAITSPTGATTTSITYSGEVVTKIQTRDGTAQFSAVKSTDGSRKVTVTTNQSSKTVYVLRADGRVKDVTNSWGGTEKWNYDAAGRTTAYKSAQDSYVECEYGDSGLLQRRITTLAEGSKSEEFYKYVEDGANAGRLQVVAKPTGLVIFPPETLDEFRKLAEVEYAYDAAGNLTKKTVGPSGTTQAVTTYAYASGQEAAVGGGLVPKGLLVKETTPGNAVTQYGYDKAGALVSETSPLGAVTGYTYDWAGREISTTVSGTGIEAVTNTYTYNGAGLLASTTMPVVTNTVSGIKSRLRHEWAYDADGNVVSESLVDLERPDGSRRTTNYTLDAFGRVLTVKGPDGKLVQQNTYDARGLATKREDGDGVSRLMQYTPQGDLERVTLPDYEASGSSAANLLEVQYTYDKAGRVKTATDRAGVVREYTYYQDDQVRQIEAFTDASREQSRIELIKEYDKKGRVTGTDDNGQVSELEYNSLGHVVAITTGTGDQGFGPQARQLTRQVDTRGLPLSETITATGSVRTTDYKYDAAGNVVQIAVGSKPADPDAAITKITRDVLGRQRTLTDPRSTTERPITTQQTWDARGQLITTITTGDSGSAIAKTGYDAYGNPTHTLSPTGAIVETTYDLNNRKTAQTYPYRSGEASSSRTWTYSNAGRITEHADPSGAHDSFEYDNAGQLIRTIRSGAGESDTVTRWEYDIAGNPVKQELPDGTTITSAYDPFGRMVEQRRPHDGSTATATFTYDQRGNQTSATSPGGRLTKATYNTFDEPTSITTPEGRTTKFIRDVAGRVVESRESSGTLSPSTNLIVWTNHDSRDNPVRLSFVDPSDSKPIQSWNWSYDKNGNQTRQINPIGGQRSFEYGPQGQLTKTILEDGESATLRYDLSGNVQAHTDPNGNITEMAYSARNDIVSMTEPATAEGQPAADRRTTWTYDKLGRRTTENRPGAATRTFTYDRDGNVTKETATLDGKAASRIFSYDQLERLTEFDHPDGKQKLTYNESGLVTTSTGPIGDAAFSYDADGNVTKLVDANGTTQFDWGKTGLLNTVTDPSGEKYYYTYKSGQLTSIASVASTEKFTYDLLGNLTSQLVTRAEETLVDDTYTYDAAGNRTSRTSSRTAGQRTTYTYDLRDRLTGWTTGSETHTAQWDASGNLTKYDDTARTYNARNQLVANGDTEYTYAPDGRRTSAGDVAYTYNPFGELSSAGGNTYTYDGLGRLAAAGDRKFHYPGLDRNPSAIGDNKIIREPSGTPLATGGGRTFSDQHGDLIGALAPDGTLADTTYSPFGLSTDTDDALGYQGDYTADGLVNMDARWYDTATGTFTSRDNVALNIDQSNRYSYALGNPLAHSDPSGHCIGPAIVICGGIAIGTLEAIVISAVFAGISLAGIYAFSRIDFSNFNFNFEMPNLSIPKISIPKVSIPSMDLSGAMPTFNFDFSTPSYNFAMKDLNISAPRIRVPEITMPKISIPDISAKVGDLEYSTPRIDVPHINVPTISIPKISIPKIGTFNPSIPHIAVPDISIPTINIPDLSMPSVSIPDISYPGLDIPDPSIPQISIPDLPSLGLGAFAPKLVLSTAHPNDPTRDATPEIATTGGRSKLSPGCEPGEILGPSGECEDPLDFLQRKTDEIRDRLAGDPGFRRQQLSRAEQRAERTEPWLRILNNGKAVERALRREVDGFFSFRGGKGRPDFVSRETGRYYEVTTTNPRTLQNHLRRPYVDPSRVAAYKNWLSRLFGE
ncbi:RHS repeat-associated core domain-containing protein [Microlunatus sp. GCM10028923]|uniref:RHS repeat-associated core domain-containing protein n=1 Tax=Microlunatus sp. GCM10028923 TaxID=3273400 RepID=UPI0036196F1A